VKETIKKILLEDKQEKFIDYVVNDMVSGIKINISNYDESYDVDLFDSSEFYYTDLIGLKFFQFAKEDRDAFEDLWNYLHSHYGITEEDYQVIWDKLRQKAIKKFLDTIGEDNG
jgi:hypothetical protein